MISRRNLLGKTAAATALVAGAAAASAFSAHAEPKPAGPKDLAESITQPPIPNTRQYDKARAYQDGVLHQCGELEAELEATLTPEQRKLFRRLEETNNDLLVAEQNLYVEALAAHFPGLAPAFRAVACLSHGDTPYLTCCEYWKVE